jgi:hypothetical protein
MCVTAPHASPNHYSRGAAEILLSFRIRLRCEERKGVGNKIRTVRSPVGHGMSFGWVAGPMKSRDSVYSSPMGGSL